MYNWVIIIVYLYTAVASSPQGGRGGGWFPASGGPSHTVADNGQVQRQGQYPPGNLNKPVAKELSEQEHTAQNQHRQQAAPFARDERAQYSQPQQLPRQPPPHMYGAPPQQYDYTSPEYAPGQELEHPLADNRTSALLYGSDLSQVDKDFIFDGLKKLYQKKILPLEMASKYAHFGSPPLGPSDFEAKPMVLVMGQYSVGKTSFIRSLLRQDFPGQRIGPEPTTDRFTAIMYNTDPSGDRLIPGHALVMQSERPFRGLSAFGNNFLSKFEGAEVSSAILRNITIIDSPGVLAGEKQRIGRDYDYAEVVKWFAERSDMIIIMFDAHKLDISDELKAVLDTLRPHQDKMKVILNKADSIDPQALLRVYGALMWALGKVVRTPEVVRVFMGSFWEAPLRSQENRALLEREKNDLLNELTALPQNAVVRRINELVKRARSVKVHAYILHYLRKQMPYVLGKAEKQAKLIERLDKEFLACARRYNLPLGDFPPVDKYRSILREIRDISEFRKLDKSLVYEMDKMLTHDIPLLLQKATRVQPQSAAPLPKPPVGGALWG